MGIQKTPQVTPPFDFTGNNLVKDQMTGEGEDELKRAKEIIDLRKIWH